MKQIKIIKKTKYDLGVNTYLNNKLIISSVKMYDGTTLYNVYKNEINNTNLIIEDYELGYYELLKEIKSGDIK